MKFFILTFFGFVFFGSTSFADAPVNTDIRKEIIVNSKTDAFLGSFILTGTSTKSDQASFKVLVNLSCFRTNLRSVANPISPMATVKMNIGIGPNASLPSTPLKNGAGDFSVLFPGWMVMNRNSSSRAGVFNLPLQNVSNSGQAYGEQNIITVLPPSGTGVSFNSRGLLQNSRNQNLTTLSYVNFEQYVSGTCLFGTRAAQISKPASFLNFFASILSGTFSNAGGGGYGDSLFNDNVKDPTNPVDTGWGEQCGAPGTAWAAPTSAQRQQYQMYQGVNGKLTGNWSSTWSSDYSLLTINASFPGENGFCGGYFSPLMLFFDGQNPQFTGDSNFQLSGQVGKIHWPEADHPGYFLVLDRNGDGAINDGTELFGADANFENGFEALAVYDQNGDGIIDAKDPIFSKLRLWKDSKGNGISRKRDLWTLAKMGISRIDLNYQRNEIVMVGNRAELREKSKFTFHKKSSPYGQFQEGRIVDVWFSNRP